MILFKLVYETKDKPAFEKISWSLSSMKNILERDKNVPTEFLIVVIISSTPSTTSSTKKFFILIQAFHT